MRIVVVVILFVCFALSALLIVAVGQAFEYNTTVGTVGHIPEQATDDVFITIPAVEIPLSAIPMPSGLAVEENISAIIDYSNMEDGYIMVRYSASTDRALCVKITTPNSTEYIFELNNDMEYEILPLTEGNGEYNIVVLRQHDDRYFEIMLEYALDVDLADELSPFLRTNQYVNYDRDSLFLRNAVNIGVYTSDYEIIEAVHDFLVDNMTYCTSMVEFVSAGYIPCLDRAYTEMNGACFDYAALMTAMLRVHDIPSKLVIGYFLDEYHAWVEAYTETSGWIRKDPATISAGNRGRASSVYVSDDSNYIATRYY